MRVPPVPEAWLPEADRLGAPSMRLVGAGLGLYGLRPVPMVGRELGRRALWASLSEVRRSGRARAVLLHGDAGYGKTRLVRWLTERAHELGAAEILKAQHGPLAGPGDGLPRMLQKHYSTVGLDYPATLERTETLMRESGVTDEYQWLAMSRLMRPDAPPGEARVVQFHSPSEWYAPVRNFLNRLSERRPVILVLDDIQWGSDAIGFARYVLKRQDTQPCPVLFAMTARDDALLARPVESSMLGDLMDMPASQHIEVGRLSVAECQQLVRGLLGLEGELAAQVETRSGGNPLFAVQLVGDWVRRGVLEVSESGFALKSGELAEIPDNIHQLWVSRVARALSGLPSSVEVALELAAALGLDVDSDEWQTVCRYAALDAHQRALERLYNHRLARPAESGWRFVHGMLRESLERVAREQGRWMAHNRACAAMLRERGWAEQPAIAERLGRHLIVAGDFAQAVTPLLLGAQGRDDRSEYRAARNLLRLRLEALERAAVDESDERWGEGWALIARIDAEQGRLDEAESGAEKAAAEALERGWDESLADALYVLGLVSHQRGTLGQASDQYWRSLRLFQSIENPLGEANCYLRLGELARLRGALPESIDLIEEALEVYRELDHRRGISMCLRNLGVSAQHAGDDARASQLFHRALGITEDDGNQHGTAMLLNDLAEVDRARGAIERAEKGYRRAQRILDSIGSADSVISQTNLGLVLLTQERYDDARDVLESALERLEATGRRWFLGAVHVALLCCAAATDRWVDWDAHLERGCALVTETAAVAKDLAWTAELAGRLAADAGQDRRATGALQLAQSQWRAVGDTSRVREITRRLDALSEL